MKKIAKVIVIIIAVVLAAALAAGYAIYKEFSGEDIKYAEAFSEEELPDLLRENFTTGYESVYIRMKDVAVDEANVVSYIRSEISNDTEDLCITPLSYVVSLYEHFDIWKFQLYYDSTKHSDGDSEGSSEGTGGHLSYTQEEIEEAGAQVSAALDRIVPEIQAAGDETDMHRAIFEYLCNNVEYDRELSNIVAVGDTDNKLTKNSGAYGALVTGKTVCSGYAAAYKAICDRLGLDCWVAESQEHAWNLIIVDGVLSCVDATSGDQDTWIADQLFMISPEDYAEEYGYKVSKNCYLPERFQAARQN